MTDRHRTEDVCAILDPVAADLAPETAVHGLLATRSAPTSARGHAWLADPPPGLNQLGTVHVTPTSASWRHAVEGFVAQRARQRRKTAIVNALDDGRAAVDADIEPHNAPNAHEARHGARPCRWLAGPG